MKLHELEAPEGANRPRKRIGRGESSGQGKTAGKGHKGQLARTGKGKPRRGFEGGQVQMFRRMPKRGFVNIFAIRSAEVNLDVLSAHFEGNDWVELPAVVAAGLASKRDQVLRVLGRGTLQKPLKIRAHHFTKSAQEKIEAAGGVCEWLNPPEVDAAAEPQADASPAPAAE